MVFMTSLSFARRRGAPAIHWSAGRILQDPHGKNASTIRERCLINSIVLCEIVWVLRGTLLSTVEFSFEDNKELVFRAVLTS